MKALPKLTGFTVGVTEVIGRGDFAVATGTFHLTMQMPDGSTGKDDGSFIEVHERQADGSWRFTSPQLGAAAPAAYRARPPVTDSTILGPAGSPRLAILYFRPVGASPDLVFVALSSVAIGCTARSPHPTAARHSDFRYCTRSAFCCAVRLRPSTPS